MAWASCTARSTRSPARSARSSASRPKSRERPARHRGVRARVPRARRHRPPAHHPRLRLRRRRRRAVLHDGAARGQRPAHGWRRSPIARRAGYLRDVATSLALLHARRLLHRDLSPRNVRATRDGRCKLLDFGALTGFGPSTHVVGHAARGRRPRRCAAAPLDQRSDLYALGALALLAADRTPRVSGQAARRAAGAVGAPASRRRRRCADGIPPELDELVLALAQPRSAGASGERRRGDRASSTSSRSSRPRTTTRSASSRRASWRRRTSSAARPSSSCSRARVAAAIAGRGGAVLIEAAAGMGRTRLLEEIGVLGQLAGAHVLRVDASMHRQLHGTARALVQALARRRARTRPRRRRGSRPRRWRRSATSASRMRMRALDAGAIDARGPVARRRRVARELVRGRQRSTPLLIQVDNVEYADDSSLGMLAALARGCARSQAAARRHAASRLAGARRRSASTALRPHCERVTLDAARRGRDARARALAVRRRARTSRASASSCTGARRATRCTASRSRAS